MPKRSAVLGLPEAVREDLNRRLVDGGFCGYESLSDWLQGQGYQISRSAVHRYGAALEAEFSDAMADARRANEIGRAAMGDDDGSGLRRSMTAIAQETLLRILMGLRKAEAAGADEEGNVDPAELARSMSMVTRAMADLGRLGLADSKYAAEQVKQFAEAAAARVETAAQARGLSADDAKFWREQVLMGV